MENYFHIKQYYWNIFLNTINSLITTPYYFINLYNNEY